MKFNYFLKIYIRFYRMSRRASKYYKARRDTEHLSATQHGMWTWGLYVCIEEYVGILYQESPQWI